MKRSRDQSPQAISLSSRLCRGDSIETDQNARLRLRLLPGILAELSERSFLEIEKLHVAKDGNAMFNAMRLREARIRLHRGLLQAVVEKSDLAGGTLFIETAFGAIRVPGPSVCRIEITDKRVRILCARGQLQIQPNGNDERVLEAGFFQDWPNAIAKPAEEDGQIQSAAVSTLDSERDLLSLEKQERFAPVPWRRTIPGKP